MDQPSPTPLARALGRVPTGLFLVSVGTPAGPVGFIGSFVVQVGLDPPTLCVAVGKGRGQLTALRAAGRFGVSILDRQSQEVMGRFFGRVPAGQSPFDGLALERAPGGTPVLAGALAWLECALEGEHETGDHVVVFGRVTDGRLVREGEPAVHLRKNGLAY
jgi:flavin reductase (DIM6/NTAB) family NADH-FMN oxidoreductase RutF